MWPVPTRGKNWWDEETVPAMQSLGQWLSELWENMPETPSLVGTYPVDIEEQDGSIVVDAEMPGFKKDEITINVDGDVLRIAAERDIQKPEGRRHLKERRFSRVDRVLTLPATVEESGAKAELKNGVLHIELAKTEGSRGHEIEVR